MSYDTIVVGLGAAGAAAAARLAAAGRRVLALEAQGQVGGRVCSAKLDGGYVEVGAEWIHGTVNSAVHDLAVSAGVELKRQDLTLEARASDGSEPDRAVVNDLVDHALAAMGDLPGTAMPLGEYLKSRVMSHIKRKHPRLLEQTEFLEEFFSFLNLLINNYEASDDWNDVTTASKYAELDGHQHVSWGIHGYHTLFDILLNKYNGGPGYPTLQVKLNTEVTNISFPSLASIPVRVRTSDGMVYDADSVIVTVSLGVLKACNRTLFSPPLPKDKIRAIETLAFGVMDKIILHFDAPWWPRNVSCFAFIWRKEERNKLEKHEQWITRIFGASIPMGDKFSMTLWTSGEVAKMVETFPAKVIKRNCVKLLKMFFGEKVTEPKGVIWSKWYNNPYTRGSYSHDSVKAANFPDARPTLARPLFDQSGRPRILFAGEATNYTHFSTVHGAIETGLREANRLLPSSKV